MVSSIINGNSDFFSRRLPCLSNSYANVLLFSAQGELNKLSTSRHMLYMNVCTESQTVVLCFTKRHTLGR